MPVSDETRLASLQRQCRQLEAQVDAQTRELNLLLSDRDLPLPHTFMDMVRKLGAAFGLILPPLPTEDNPGAASN